MIITDVTTGRVLAERAVLADTPFTRMKGLLGRASLSSGEGMVITACRSIHMLFMRFAIDVVFVDRGGVVVGLVEKIGPFGFSPVFWNAAAAIELPAGTIALTGVRPGHRIEYQIKK